MASIVTKSHLRSNSLPSSPHPLISSVEEQLQRLRSSEAASSSASSVCQKLAGLGDLYNCIDDWLQLSLSQKALSNGIHMQSVEGLLDGSLAIIDVCGTLREVFLQMKESIRELESSLRRRGLESGSAKEIESYLTSRKKMKKLISNSFQSLKKLEKQIIPNNDSEEEATLHILREAQRLSITVFESLLCFVSRPRSRSSSWSFVSKAVSSKRISCNEESNEVEHLDVTLLGLKSGKASNIQVHEVRNRVQALESSIQEIEEISECVFRCLVKTRVSLLNSLNH